MSAVEHALPQPARRADHSFLVPVSRLRPSPRRARLSFDEHALDALADSLREWGQLQPVVVHTSNCHVTFWMNVVAGDSFELDDVVMRSASGVSRGL